METKKCSSACKLEKPLSEFDTWQTKSGEVRYRALCRSCNNKNMLDWQRRRRESVDGWAANVIKSAKARAKVKGLEFSLTTEWFVERIKNGYCEVTNLPFDTNRDDRRVSARNPWAPSLDRIDNSKGYTPENVQVVVWMYNQFKGEWTHDELMVMVRALAKPLFKKAIESGRISLTTE